VLNPEQGYSISEYAGSYMQQINVPCVQAPYIVNRPPSAESPQIPAFPEPFLTSYSQKCFIKIYSPEQIVAMFDMERRDWLSLINGLIVGLAKDRDFIEALLSHPSAQKMIEAKAIEILKKRAN
jgi:hypothetical protein